MTDITLISEYKNKEETPQELIEWECENMDARYNKIMVIKLEARKEEYNVGISQAGMKHSELLALLDVVKTRILVEMGFIADGE